MGRKHPKGVNAPRRSRQPEVATWDANDFNESWQTTASSNLMSILMLPCIVIRTFVSRLIASLCSALHTLTNMCRRELAITDDGGAVAISTSAGRKNNLNEDHLVRLLLKRRDGEVRVDETIQEDFQRYLRSPSNAQVQEMVILRGPPGIGKSTFAYNLLLEKTLVARLAHVCSTDDFFTRIHAGGRETYCFDEKKLRQNHGKNQERVRLALALGLTPVIVDNTHMSLGEMTAYKKVAKKAGYCVRVVEPHEIEPRWCDLQFLQERNCDRKPAGKKIGKSILKTMLQRFEPSHGQALPAECRDLHKEKNRKPTKTSASLVSRNIVPLPVPEYIGVCLEDAFGGSSGLRNGLWTSVRNALQDKVEDKLLDISRYIIPKPLHVTTFHSRELKGRGVEATAALEDAFASEGNHITFYVEFVAVVVGALACAVVTRANPPLPAPAGKLLHITLATCSPWRPVQSNLLLKAILDACAARRVPVGNKSKGDALWSFLTLDLSDILQTDSVRVFEGLRIGDRSCIAHLIRLQEPLKMIGPRFRHS